MVEKVRCKMQCTEVGTVHGGLKPLYKARFSPVWGHGPDEEENKKFWEATPSGVLELNCTKEQFFECGRHYYIDILPA